MDIKSTTYLAAYLIEKSENNSLDRLKLLKLLYLSDRENLSKTGVSISLDTYVSMNMGPVLSETYNIIKNAANRSPETPQIWIELIETNGYKCSLKTGASEKINVPSFTKRVADQIWQEHGHKSGVELANFTHSLPEWQDPKGSSIPIRIKTILENCGYTTDDAEYYEEEYNRLRQSLN